jgi:hypothetical protein
MPNFGRQALSALDGLASAFHCQSAKTESRFSAYQIVSRLSAPNVAPRTTAIAASAPLIPAMLTLSCLCGQVRISSPKRPDVINTCNCTL